MSREAIIRQIVHRDVEQLGLTEEIVREEAVELYEAACDHFGTWETALTYAGVDMRHVRQRKEYSSDRVLQAIRTLCISSYDLTAMHNMRRDRQLYEAARKHFGTWKKAVAAAGINLEHAFARRPRKLSKQDILDTIRHRHANSASLIWTDICLENRSFASAAKHAFGSWRRALIAAGIDPTLHRNQSGKRWDQQRVIECIRRRQQEGQSLKCSDVYRNHRSLVNAAQRYFGSWGAAIRAAKRGLVLVWFSFSLV